jgi:hypothetical protein
MRINPANSGRVMFNLGGIFKSSGGVGTSGSAFQTQSEAGAPQPKFVVVPSTLSALSAAGSSGFLATAGNISAGGRVRELLADLRSLVAAAPTYGPAVSTPGAGLNAPSTARSPNFATYSTVVTRTQVTGVNPSQVAGVQFGRLAPGQWLTVQGEVTRTAEAATLTIRGNAAASATAGGTYELSGSRGSATFVVTAGESLAALGARINDQIAVTGIEAEASGNDLVLRSIDLGRDAVVSLQPVEAEHQLAVAGVNAGQIARFDVASFTPGAAEAITGRLESAAQGAELVYRGASGNVAGTASFRLTGARGALDVAIVEGETLTAVAQRINQATFATGVIATVAGDDIRLTSDTTGTAARVEISAIERDYDTTISGVNASQVADFSVTSLDEGSQHLLAGQVTRSASQAELVLQGSAGGTVIDSATFELRGTLGNATLAITAGESLSAVAGRVNALAGSTGVVAAAVGSQLRLASSDVGSSAQVEVDLLHVAHATTVSGVNNQQLSTFQVEQFTEGAAQTLSGSITQTASQAQLTFTGNFFSRVGSNATFRLTGSQGSVQLSVTSFQSVSSLATQVNQHTQTTGVSATVQGNKVHFRSVGVGSAAVVDIDVLSGSFNVTGGNGQGTATGTNAVAVVNGQTVTGAGNNFQFTDSVGTYAFTSASGFTGAFSPVNIVSQAGSFQVSGGNGDGTASGLDGLATINGALLTGVRNRFAVGELGGQFEVEFTAGFAGQFDPITIASTADPFDISGGDGAGTSLGSDARAVFNGTEQTSADGSFVVQGEHGTYAIEFAAGFTGDFDPVSVASTPQLLEIEGSEEYGRDTGEDAEAVINGQRRFGTASTFRFVEGGRDVTLAFQADFQGAFDTIEAFGTQRTVHEVVRLPASSRQQASEHSEIGSRPANPLDTILQELDGLLADAGESEAGSPVPPSASSTPLLTKAAIVSQQFGLYSQQSPFASVDGIDAQTPGSLKQLRRLVDLVA